MNFLGEVFTLNSGLSFHVLEHVSEGEMEKFSQQTDYPTVWCREFMCSMASEQHYPVLFRIERNGALIALTLGMFRCRFLRSQLVFPSYPRFLEDSAESKSVFWQGVDKFCRKHGVVRVAVNSYEAPELQVAELRGLTQTKERSEFFIDLTRDLGELLRSFSSSHRRNIKKAQKHDLELSISQNGSILEEHLIAFSHTATRRQSRNETVPGVNEQLLRKLLNSQNAIVMQLHQGHEIISSIYIILTPKSAFYFSGGTTPEGTRIGAFHYLIWSAIEELQNRGVASLTLGGADSDTPEGLRRFKLGFNAREVQLTHNEYLLGFPVFIPVAKFLQKIQNRPASLFTMALNVPKRLLAKIVKISRWEMYSLSSEPEPVGSRPGADFELRQLAESDYNFLEQQGGRFAEQAKLYYRDRGISTAYGLYVKEELAHVSWVYTAEEYAKESVAQIRLGPEDAEITNCYTLDKFRGRNLYACALQHIAIDLLRLGKTRIITKVERKNIASKRGIVKAGFRRDGSVVLLELPALKHWPGMGWKIGSN